MRKSIFSFAACIASVAALAAGSVVRIEGTEGAWRLTRNGKPYKWHVMNNKGYFDVTGIDVPCFVYCDLDKDNKDILQDGEEISLEVRKIDRRTYDYLYALAKAEQSASNPIRNFSNPATLGYFSAYNSVRKPALRFKKEALQYYEEIEESKKTLGN